jgi:hypothetical protein
MKRSLRQERTPTGLNGFDLVHLSRGSVSVQARDHRERHRNQLSADSNQRDYALAA